MDHIAGDPLFTFSTRTLVSIICELHVYTQVGRDYFKNNIYL